MTFQSMGRCSNQLSHTGQGNTAVSELHGLFKTNNELKFKAEIGYEKIFKEIIMYLKIIK